MILSLSKGQTWVQPHLSVDFYKEGASKGFLGMTLEFTGNEGNQDVMMDVLEVILANTAKLPKSHHLIRLTGFFHPQEKLLDLFVKSLQDYGFSVQAIMAPDAYRVWGAGVWVIQRQERPLVASNASEIWYKPVLAPDVLAIPDLTNIPPRTRPLLYLSREYTVSATMEFVARSNYFWALL